MSAIDDVSEPHVMQLIPRAAAAHRPSRGKAAASGTRRATVPRCWASPSTPWGNNHPKLVPAPAGSDRQDHPHSRNHTIVPANAEKRFSRFACGASWPEQGVLLCSTGLEVRTRSRARCFGEVRPRQRHRQAADRRLREGLHAARLAFTPQRYTANRRRASRW